MKSVLLALVLIVGCSEKPAMLMHEQRDERMAFRRVKIGSAPIRQSHGVDVETFGEAPPEIEFTRDDLQEFDATEETPDALAELREVTQNPISIVDGKLITSVSSMPGRVVTIPPQQRMEIMSLRMESEDIQQAFSLYVGQEPDEFFTAAFNAPVDFEAYRSSGSPGAPAMNYAMIEWGAGGVQKKAILDIIPSQVINLAGSFVRVTGINGNGIFPAGQDIRVGAFVSLLPRVSRKSPQKSLTFGPINAGATNTVALAFPPFARSFKVYRHPGNAPFEIVVFGAGGANYGSWSVPAGSDSPEIELPGNITGIDIVNGAVAINRGVVIFYLDL